MIGGLILAVTVAHTPSLADNPTLSDDPVKRLVPLVNLKHCFCILNATPILTGNIGAHFSNARSCNLRPYLTDILWCHVRHMA